MMQPRPSDNQHRISLPEVGAKVPHYAGGPLSSESEVADSISLAGGFLVGASSRAARVESVARDLSMHAVAVANAKREESRVQLSGQWSRVDGQHKPLRENVIHDEHDSPAVGAFDKDLEPELRDLLSQQMTVCATTSKICEDAENSDTRSEQSGTLLQTMCAVMTSEVCGLHEQVSQEILQALRVENENSAAEVSAQQNVGSEPTDSSQGEVSVEKTNPFVTGQPSVDRSVDSTSFLHGSELVACEVSSFEKYPLSIKVREEKAVLTLSRASGVPAEAILGHASAQLTTKTVCRNTIDANGLIAAPQRLAELKRTPTPISKPDCIEMASAASGGVDPQWGGSTFHVSGHGRVGSATASLQSPEQLDFSNVTHPSQQYWHQYFASAPGQESVRWFVGDLLLPEENGAGEAAGHVLAAVAELDAIAIPFANADEPVMCGRWVARSVVPTPVDIHRVVLWVHENRPSLSGSQVIVASLNSTAIASSTGNSFYASAEVQTPRCWTRFAEFQHPVGASPLFPPANGGQSLAWAYAYGGESYFCSCHEFLIHDVSQSIAAVLFTTEVVAPRRSCTIRPWKVSKNDCPPGTFESRSSVRRSDFVWDVGTRAFDVVAVSTGGLSQPNGQVFSVVDMSSAELANTTTDDLVQRIRTGPVFRDGNDNVRPISTLCCAVCDSASSGDSGLGEIAKLDERFLGTWSLFTNGFSSSEHLIHIRNDLARGWSQVDAGNHESGLADASAGQQSKGCGVLSNTHINDILHQSLVVMRPAESAAAMQAATSFFFRHRLVSAWRTEQVSNVVMQQDSPLVNQYVTFCDGPPVGHVSTDLNCLPADADCDVLHVFAQGDDITVQKWNVNCRLLVICVESTHACTLTHVPQYLNRAAWCRDINPRLLAASSTVDVAEEFFPPLVSFELPRLVNPGRLNRGARVHASGSMIVCHDSHVQFFAESSARANARSGDAGPHSLDMQNAPKLVLDSKPVCFQLPTNCATRSIVKHLQTASSMRLISDPLRNYLRANWSLSEVIGGGQLHKTGVSGGGTRFLVMTDKRSLDYLQATCGIELVSQLFVESNAVCDRGLRRRTEVQLLHDERLSQCFAIRASSLSPIKCDIMWAASITEMSLSCVTEIGDIPTLCKVQERSLLPRVVGSAMDSMTYPSEPLVVWRPGAPQITARAKPVSVQIPDFENESVATNVEGSSSSAPVLVEVAEGPTAFASRPVRHPGVIASGNQQFPAEITSANLQHSFQLSEKCRIHTCTISSVHRAA